MRLRNALMVAFAAGAVLAGSGTAQAIPPLRAFAAAALAALGLAVPAYAATATGCLGSATLVVAGSTVVDQDLGCVEV
jgi:hypothetical protein